MPSRIDSVFLEPVGQGRGVAEAEQPSGAGLVAGGQPHRLLKVVRGDPVDGGSEINPLGDILRQGRVARKVPRRARQQGVAGVLSMIGPGVQTAARRRVFCISRTLPGQGCSSRSFLALTERILGL